MKPYRTYASEMSTFQDRVSGQTVTKLTGHLGHSHHPYFTDDGWYQNDKKMLFAADRHNSRNLHSIDIETGEISQLTDLPEVGGHKGFSMQVNHVLNETYYTYNRCVYAMNLETLETRPLYIIPHGYDFGGARPTGDGKYVVGSLKEDLSNRIHANLTAGYIGMKEVFEAMPESKIVRINVLTGEADVVWRENYWVGHVNPSPTQGNIISFCHEGPWQMVDHRIWVLDLNTGKAEKLRERRVEGEMVGHEYWFRDGLHIGYQVHLKGEKNKRDSWFGFAKYDGTGEIEAPCVAMPSPDHIHSNGFDFVVSDSGKSIKGYKYNGKSFDGPRVLCMHDGSFDWGAHHPHPAITRDSKNVVFNSTRDGYCNIYMVSIPEDFESLPELPVQE